MMAMGTLRSDMICRLMVITKALTIDVREEGEPAGRPFNGAETERESGDLSQ